MSHRPAWRWRGRGKTCFLLAALTLPFVAGCFGRPPVRAALRARDEEAEVAEADGAGPAGSTGSARAAPPAPRAEVEEVDAWTYVFGKPGELRRDLSLVNTSPEKIVSAGLLAIIIGLASNLWGQTELLLSLVPAAANKARELRLDSIYAVDGLKAYYEEQYQARFPSTWLFDQRVALLKAGQMSSDDMLGLSRRTRPAAAPGVGPDAAWGPAGGGDRALKSRENLSVVKQTLPPKAPGQPQQISEILGDPEPSLERLLKETIAPEGSKKTAEALKAVKVERAGNTYYDTPMHPECCALRSRGFMQGCASGIVGGLREGCQVFLQDEGMQLVYPCVSEVSVRLFSQEYQWRTVFPSGAKLRSFSSCSLGPADRRGNRNLYTLTAVLPETDVVDGQGVAPLIPPILEGFIVQTQTK